MCTGWRDGKLWIQPEQCRKWRIFGGGEGGRRRWCKLVDKVIEEGSIFVAGSEMMMRTKTTKRY